MNCQEARGLLDGYFDGEFDLHTSLKMEQHLSECADCSAELETRAALHQAITQPDFYFRAPVQLRTRVKRSLPGNSRGWLWAWAAPIAAALALIAFLLPRPADSAFENAAIDAHLRSLTPEHLIDVPSSDNHTVKPWFNGKVDFSPPVADLKAHGFALTGGRLDYLADRRVAALIYKRREHVINLFEWPASASDSGISAEAVRGYNVLSWTRSGFHYYAVSDLNTKELREFTGVLRSLY